MTPRRVSSWLIGPVAMLVVALATSTGADADPVAGSQGTDTALPATDSQVTVRGRDHFSDLAITVNQTRNLANQAVSITWTGGTPTRSGPSDFAAYYLQIFQCWGDDDGSVPGHPGPPPEQCVQGAVAGAPGGGPNGTLVPGGGFALERLIKHPSWSELDPPEGVFNPQDGQVWRPFRAVDGTQIDFQTNTNFVPGFAGNYWLNPYFDIVTTNEIGVAPTAPDGTGAVLFEVNTGVQSSGLGCGQRRQPLAGGGTKVPQCWIVVVPRGAPVDENVDTHPNNEGENADQKGVVTSPVSPQAWPNRIAIPIEFNPVDSPCSIGAKARQISGTELAIPAVVSWQPVLCGGGELPPYTYARTSDSTARLQLNLGTAGMAVVSRPFAQQPVDPLKTVIYAPLTASGIVIGFNIERTPHADLDRAPPEAQALSGLRVAELNLTPRLVAKLLTSSYSNQVDILFRPSGHAWTASNPRHPYEDPDFLQFNAEFAQLQMIQGRQLSGLHVPTGNSDAARQLWEWILADPEAKAWVDGAADQWGMVVNPAYAVVTAAAPDSFPKADPYCYQPLDVTTVSPAYTPPKLCTIDWMPPATGFANAAANTRRAYDGARIGEDLANPPPSANQYWKRSNPQKIGQRGFLSVTDSASASQYGIQMARLSRAGDNGADRVFIAPTQSALTAGLASMEPRAEPQVLEPSPSTQPPNAYPLTTMTYAAVAPLTLDSQARDEYAAFLEYSAGSGQRLGDQPGELPAGYAPLPRALKEQTTAAAFLVRYLVVTDVPTTTTTTTTTTPAAPTSTTTTSTTSTTTPTRGVNNTTAQTSDPVPPTSGQQSSGTQRPTASQTTVETTIATTVPTVSPAAEPATSAPRRKSAVPRSTSPPVDDGESPTTTAPPRGITPGTPIGPMRFAIAGITGTGLLAALVLLEITKRPRRRVDGVDGLDGDGSDVEGPQPP